ncbi:MAG: PHP domain-containing protein [Planctomycetes bacterium]|nr:PHP domain-containing protein [Planctomycetota bacterium]
MRPSPLLETFIRLAVWPVAVAGAVRAQVEVLELDPALHHLGDSTIAGWPEVAAEPEGARLELEFGGRRHPGECVLELRQRDVDGDWAIELNGVRVGVLRRGKASRIERYRLPPGSLRDGPNRLTFEPSAPSDDIVLGELRLHLRSLREVLDLREVEIRVTDAASGRPLPARVSVVTAGGELAELFEAVRPLTAVRPGICYTADGVACFEVAAGDYRVHATRGMEWSVASAELHVGGQVRDRATVELALHREVDTSGWIAADTHIHTVTHSGHGDASVEERMVTLAAEGVELAIATDHNHNIDYRPTQRALGLGAHFTPVVGNEVTTAVGHVNAFPLAAADRVPDHRLTDWIQLVEDIRARGARVVILNHPRWPQIPTGPFGEFGLSRLSGELPGQRAVPFDAMELVNSTTLQNDPLFLFVDWFALLNHGVPIKAVGTSDSHTVGDPVGQGRTYVPSATDDPARIDVDRSCDAFVDGRATISFGMFCSLEVGDGASCGDTVTVRDGVVRCALRVAAPGFVRPLRALAFLNGCEVAGQEVPASDGQPTDVTLRFELATRGHDAHLVFVVLGDGVTGPYWRTERPYTLAATNPVWLDCDGTGGYRSPRETGERLAGAAGRDPAKLGAALADVDDAVAVQALHAARVAWEGGSHVPSVLRRVRELLTEVAGDRPVLTRYVAELPELPER